jgi:alkyl sulfatase BDS1-like metallo-beta-lactamase superfamily hydrolase
MGAHELRYGNVGTPTKAISPSMMAALSVDQIFDAISLRVDGPKAWHERSVSDWRITDENRTHRVELRNGLMIHYDRFDGDDLPAPETTFALSRPTLIGVLLCGQDIAAAVRAGQIVTEGDIQSFGRLIPLFDQPNPDFAIATPQ